MRTEKLKAVTVFEADGVSEHYKVGQGDITAVEWGITPGLHCDINTVRVFKNGSLLSEHPFHSCVSVYFEES